MKTAAVGRNVRRGIRSLGSIPGAMVGALAWGFSITELAVLGEVSSIPGGLEAVSTTSGRTGNRVIG